MKTNPWHSTEQKQSAFEHKDTVYHDNSSCTEGNKVLKEHSQSGTNSRPLCKECAELNDKGLLITNNTIVLEDLLRALREVQSLSPKAFSGDPRTQIDLPEVIMTRTRVESSRIGVSPEVFIMALLQAFNNADDSFKTNLAKELNSVIHAGEHHSEA